jgi:hypothetical protein
VKESIGDIKIGWHVFKDNYKSYIAVELFVIAGMFGFVLLGLLFFIFVEVMIFLSLELPREIFFVILILIFLMILFVFFFSAFTGTLYGLTYDIMSSGDLYTEFKHAFTYFRKFWKEYILISIPFLIVSLILEFTRNLELILKLPIILLEFLAIIILVEIYPSMTAQGSLKRGVKENFHILRSEFKRLFASIGFFFFIFRLPIHIFIILGTIFSSDENISLVFLFLFYIFVLINSMIGAPILSIISTRIYNTVDLERSIQQPK